MRIKTLFSVLAVTAALLVTAVALAAGDGASKSSKATASLTVSTRSVTGLGVVLVNSKGRTLYMFVPDKQKAVTCFTTCAKIWPPLKLPAGAKLVATGSAKAKLLGSDADKAGGRVVTYNHWPVYTYLGDTKAGVATGQALNVNGGLWYVLAPSGALIKAKVKAPTPTTTTAQPVNNNTTNPPVNPGGQACGDPAGIDQDSDGDLNNGGADDLDGCV